MSAETYQWLIIEDHAFERDQLRQALLALGQECFAVSTSEDALAYLKLLPIDVVLCDKNLGDGEVTGLEILEQYRQLPYGQDGFFILMSGHERETLETEAVERGANLYMPKLGTLTDPVKDFRAWAQSCLEQVQAHYAGRPRPSSQN